MIVSFSPMWSLTKDIVWWLHRRETVIKCCWFCLHYPNLCILWLWTLEVCYLVSCGLASVGQPTINYLQQLCTDTGCSLKDLALSNGTNGKKESGKSELAAQPNNIVCYFFILFFFVFINFFSYSSLFPIVKWKNCNFFFFFFGSVFEFCFLLTNKCELCFHC